MSIQLKPGFCSALGKLTMYLHNLIGTEKCSPWSCKRCCQLDYSIHGLGSPDNQRLLHAERILTLLFHHALPASGLGYCIYSKCWMFKQLLGCCCFIGVLETKLHSSGRGGVKPCTVKMLTSEFVHHWSALAFFMLGWSCIETNVSIKPLALI